MKGSSLLEQVLQSGKELWDRGRQAAEKRLDIPESGPERGESLSRLGKGALVGGVLGLLLGTRSGRRLGGTALKLGSLAALGTVGYRAFQKWKAEQKPGATPAGKSATWLTSDGKGFLHELTGEDADARSYLLLRAMIGAAKADGRIDAQERSRIDEQIKSLGIDREAASFLQHEINKPLDPREFARGVDSMPAAVETYLASTFVVDSDHPAEREYLKQLADALGIDAEFAQKIEAEANTA